MSGTELACHNLAGCKAVVRQAVLQAGLLLGSAVQNGGCETGPHCSFILFDNSCWRQLSLQLHALWELQHEQYSSMVEMCCAGGASCSSTAPQHELAAW
jgi:hypothetical protein